MGNLIRSSGVFPLRRQALRRHVVKLSPDWTAETFESHAAIRVSTSESLAFEELIPRAHEIADRALDLLSVSGGGHHEILPKWDGRVFLVSDRGRVRVEVWGEIQFSVPAAIFTQPATLSAPDPTRSRASYHIAMRHLRRAQLSSDMFSAFHSTWLAFESLLSTRVPKSNDDRIERKWLWRALREVTPTYGRLYGPDLQGDAAIGRFIDEVYEKARNAVFHAKSDRGPVTPLDRSAQARLSDAHRFLLSHTRELLAEILGWGESRLLTDAELRETGDQKLGPPSIDFYPIEVHEPSIRVETRLIRSSAGPLIFHGATQCGNSVHQDHIGFDSFAAAWGPMRCVRVRLPVLVPATQLAEVGCHLRLGDPMDFLFRTSFD